MSAWFKPKTYGYGAAPANWKGWAATLGFVVAMVAWSLGAFGLTPRRSVEPSEWLIWAFGVAALTIGFMTVARRKTDGEWKWRGFDK